MTSDKHYYMHRETGIIAEITDSAAAVFEDRLIRVDGPEDNKPARSSRKATNDDSPKKEGNE